MSDHDINGGNNTPRNRENRSIYRRLQSEYALDDFKMKEGIEYIMENRKLWEKKRTRYFFYK